MEDTNYKAMGINCKLENIQTLLVNEVFHTVPVGSWSGEKFTACRGIVLLYNYIL